MPQFIYDKNGRPIEAPAEAPTFEPAKALNDKCPTCGNRHTVDMPSRNTSTRSQVTTKKVRCDDCDTVFDATLETPLTPPYKRPKNIRKWR